MKILFIAHRIPFPPNKGDKIRAFNELRYLAKTHEVDLACLADDPADLRHRWELEKLCRRVLALPLGRTRSRAVGAASLLSGRALSTAYFHSPALQKGLDRWTGSEDYDAAICFSSTMAEYLFRSPAWRGRFDPVLRPRDGRRSTPRSPGGAETKSRAVMDFCDVDSDKWKQYARTSRFPRSLLFEIESRRLLQYEMRVNRAFDHSVFVSRPEAELFEKLFPKAKNVRTLCNGVDHTYFSPNLDPPARGAGSNGFSLLFTGAMDYHANVDGVVWFADEVFPAVRSRCPEAVFTIVGNRPAPRVRALAERPGVRVTGFVEDVRPYYAEAAVCVNPLRLARGVQNKVLEAMSMARPVVTTSRANQGIGALSGQHLVVRDTVSGFQEAVVSLLGDRAAGEALGRRARDFVCEHYDWDRNLAALEELLA